MKLIYEGKTKDVYQRNDGNIQFHFKDDVTGEDGKFDPGADTVGAVIDGVGRANLQMSTFFFKMLNELNIPTHYIAANLDEQTMIVKNVAMFGYGLEVICRFRAVGSFYRRYSAYCKEGEKLNSLVEFTLKDDD